MSDRSSFKLMEFRDTCVSVSGCDTHSHYDAHALALVGKGENLQDGEVQDLSTRCPQLH